MTELIKDVLDAEKLKQYESLGTVEQLSKRVNEEDVLKFYYCESENEYLVGLRMGTLYYAEVEKTGLHFFMSRYLPWGELIVDQDFSWIKYTYPSEPKEIPFFEWLTGFLKQKGVEI